MDSKKMTTLKDIDFEMLKKLTNLGLNIDIIKSYLDTENFLYKKTPKLTYMEYNDIFYKKNYPQLIQTVPVKFYNQLCTLWLSDSQYIKYIRETKNNLSVFKPFFPKLLEVKSLNINPIYNSVLLSREITEIPLSINRLEFVDETIMFNIPDYIEILDLYRLQNKNDISRIMDNININENIKEIILPVFFTYNKIDKKELTNFLQKFINLKKLSFDNNILNITNILKSINSNISTLKIDNVDKIIKEYFDGLDNLKELIITGDIKVVSIPSNINILVTSNLPTDFKELKNLKSLTIYKPENLYNKDILPNSIKSLHLISNDKIELEKIIFPTNIEELSFDYTIDMTDPLIVDNMNAVVLKTYSDKEEIKIYNKQTNETKIYSKIPYTNIYYSHMNNIYGREIQTITNTSLESLVDILDNYFNKNNFELSPEKIQDVLFDFSNSFLSYIKYIDIDSVDSKDITKMMNLLHKKQLSPTYNKEKFQIFTKNKDEINFYLDKLGYKKVEFKRKSRKKSNKRKPRRNSNKKI